MVNYKLSAVSDCQAQRSANGITGIARARRKLVRARQAQIMGMRKAQIMRMRKAQIMRMRARAPD